MFCVKCGKELNEGELFCTKCGSPVSSDTNDAINEDVMEEKTNVEVIEEKNDIEIIEEKTDAEVMEENKEVEVIEEKKNEEVLDVDSSIEEPIIEDKPVVEDQRIIVEPSTNPVIEEAPKTDIIASKNDKSAIIGGIVFASLLVLGIIVRAVLSFAFNDHTDESNTKNNDIISTPTPVIPKNTPEPSPKQKDTSKKVSYAGYQFSYSSIFKVEDKNETGLLFKNDEVAFSVLVDYTHSFEDYEQYAIDNYGGDNSDDFYESLNDNTYLLFYQRTLDLDYYTYIYVTESEDGDVFVGQFSMIDHSAADLNDVQIMDDILRTGTIDSSFSKQDEYDYGKEDVHFPPFENYFFDAI